MSRHVADAAPADGRAPAPSDRRDPRPYALRVLADDDALNACVDAWDRLADRCGARSFFSRHLFATQSWARHRGDRTARLHVVVVERGGEFVLVLPLVRKRGWSGLWTLRGLDSKTPLYNDALVDPDADFDVLRAMVGRHLASVPLARVLKIGFVRADSMLARLLGELGARSQSTSTTSEIDLTRYSGWDDFIAGRSRSSRQAYGRYFRRLGERGDVEIEQIGDPERLAEEIAWIFAVKRAWVLKREGKPNWLTPPETEAWFRSTAVALAAGGQAFVLRLSCGGARVASVLVYRWRDTAFASKIAYDPAWSKQSPGWLMNWKLIELALAQDIARLDLLLGADEWKSRLTADVCDVRAYRLPLRLGLFPAAGFRRR